MGLYFHVCSHFPWCFVIVRRYFVWPSKRFASCGDSQFCFLYPLPTSLQPCLTSAQSFFDHKADVGDTWRIITFAI
jgi:hypothetical protein